MRKFILNLLLLSALSGYSQIANYNSFPTMKPAHILDENLTNISFALSMRVLVSDYEGPLVRLRRANDNAVQDFGWANNDIVDVAAINTWRGVNNVYIVTWYDQSGLGRNATQSTNSLQPRFYPVTTLPYFQGDGTDDYLLISTSIQALTNAGSQGSVLGVMLATGISQFSFGVSTGQDRWSTHINWGDGNLYFDPGICCNTPRSYSNSSNENLWTQYTFVKTSTNVIARRGGIEQFNGTHTKGRCTVTSNFAIGTATGSANYATTGFNEFIMYKTDINTTQIQEIEADSQTFWGI